jgi:predicted CxxxxCH...CXXCH cytochrome family protein
VPGSRREKFIPGVMFRSQHCVCGALKRRRIVNHRKFFKGLCSLGTLLLLSACGSDGSNGTFSSSGDPVQQGVAVDPYVVGAVFQEVASDGVTVLQRESSPSDDSGVFTFPKPLTAGSTIELKASNKGLHGGAPFQGMLRRSITSDDSSSVVVSPLTTLVANGISPDEVIQALDDAGLPGLTSADLDADPMQNLRGTSSGITDQDFLLLQASMAVDALMEITGNFDAGASDLQDPEQRQILSSMVSSMQNMLSSSEFSRITTELANDPAVTQPSIGDFILAVLGQQQTMINLIKENVSANGVFDQALVDQMVQNWQGQAVVMVKEQYQIRQAQQTSDLGASLYASNCADCHGPLDSSTKPGRTAAQIQAAIDSVGAMSSLSTLTAAEVQAIADALASVAAPPPSSTPDGATLYADDCAGCHGALATTTKPGRSAAQIQAAIDSVGAMSSLSTLTTAEVQAIADVLPAAPPTDSTTPPDGIALYNSECAGCHGPLDSTAKPGRSAAQIQAAIDSVGAMSSLSTLTAAEVQAIADVLPAAPPTDPTTPPDGTILYADNCAACHGPLDSTTKPGRSAAQIQAAIDSVGVMSSLSTLTAAEVQAIADVLPPATTQGPDYSDCTACHGQPPSGTTFPNTAGAHAVHTTLPGVNDCGTCHTGAAHNGQIDLGFPATYDAKSGPATDNMDGTCNNIKCHGGQTTPDWYTGNIAVDTQCSSCHASGSEEYNSYSSGQHSRHLRRGFACTVCHNTVKLQQGHFSDLATNGFEQSAASTIGGGSTQVGTYTPQAGNPGSGTCSNINCHGSQEW